MLHPLMVAAIIDHIPIEGLAVQAYRDIANRAADAGYMGFAKWGAGESAEEYTHYVKFQDYLTARGAAVVLQDVAAPGNVGDTPLAWSLAALGLEEDVKARIDRLYGLALQQAEFDVCRFLGPFLETQTESIDKLQVLVAQLTLAGSDIGAVQAIDRELGED